MNSPPIWDSIDKYCRSIYDSLSEAVQVTPNEVLYTIVLDRSEPFLFRTGAVMAGAVLSIINPFETDSDIKPKTKHEMNESMFLHYRLENPMNNNNIGSESIL